MNTSSDFRPLLYVPADRAGVKDFLCGPKPNDSFSIAVCLEDAVRPENRLPAAKTAAEWLVSLAAPRSWRCYLRPPDRELLAYLLDLPGISNIDGFVVPKATVSRLEEWKVETAGRFPLIPILETRDVLAPSGRAELVAACVASGALIPRVRIGANDLFSLLGGLRRPRDRTIYETPVGYVIDGLIEAFSDSGVPLSGCVFDRVADLDTLRREVRDDVARGLYSKTALNPEQVSAIVAGYRPEASEVEEAHRILCPDAPAVFLLHGAMHEPACHRAWAENVLQRAAAFQSNRSEGEPSSTS